MKSTVDAVVGQGLLTWVSFIQRKPTLVLRSLIAMTLLFALIAVLKLGINSNNLDLVSPKLESRINQAEFSAVFPDLENALFVVVDGPTPAATSDAAQALVDRLELAPGVISSAYLSNGGSFFEDHGLLYLQMDELQPLLQKLGQFRPFLISLESRPNLVAWSELVVRNMRVTRFNFDYEELWEPLLDRMTDATLMATAQPSSSTSSASSALFSDFDSRAFSTRQVVIVNPILEFGSVFAAKKSITAIRNAATHLGLEDEAGYAVRVTGNPALNLEEMVGIAWDIGVAGIFCFALVIVVLIFALRSIPLVIASVATLLVGLVWMAGLAALMVGHLNIVSLSVSILFIGLGVDFTIHLGMSYADALHRGKNEQDAMRESITKIGSSLFICTISTAIGFLVFTPTAYLGVAELGLIAGTGMVVIFFLTVSLFPALLISWLRFDASKHIKQGLRFEANLGVWVQANFRETLGAALVLLVIALVVAPNARFDPNVIDMRDPSTESVQAFNELLDESGYASPWFLDALVPNLDQAQALAAQAEQLPTVANALTAASLVPSDQAQKLVLIEEVAEQFRPIKRLNAADAPNIDQQLTALEKLRDHLQYSLKFAETEAFKTKQRNLASQLSSLIIEVRTSLQASAEHHPDASPKQSADENPEQHPEQNKTLAALTGDLIGDLPEQVQRLRGALSTSQVSLDSLPKGLLSRMITPDGRARVQIFPKENLRDEQHLRDFVSDVQSISPKATGIGTNLVALEETTKNSFKQALGSALILITLLLIYLWRNLIDVVLVIAPLLLSLLLAVSCMAWMNLPFNFVNVIVIPLLFGIGVDSGIHLVHRSHDDKSKQKNLLNTTTARAVYYSALTTLISFGSLSLSAHKGIASLGVLLAIGMVLTVLSNLVVLPALLEWRRLNWRWSTRAQAQ